MLKFFANQKIPIICLVGPTASGKTAAALEIAKHYPFEIMSMDSALVFREMNVGTAKPSSFERIQVPHHLIDILDPTETYSAAQFCSDVNQLIEEILAREHFPLIVGGTMLYYRALTQGLTNLPAANVEIRKKIDEEAKEKGWPAMHSQLMQIDEKTAARLMPNDAQRIQRALEIYQITGQAMSALIADKPSHQIKNYIYMPISLEPENRAILHQRIEKRFDQMLENGFIEEVEKLRARGDLYADLPAMRTVGYRQIWSYLAGEIDYSTMRDKGIAATRQLCKRQLTWLRALSGKTVVNCCDESDKVNSQVVHLIQKIME